MGPTYSEAVIIWALMNGSSMSLIRFGSGISDEHLAKIYDPFFTTKATGVGTGLGLPVSRKIIELHGGSLDIKNIREGGVRVTITLKSHRTLT